MAHNNRNTNDEWISIDDPLEYIEITADDINIDIHLNANDSSMTSEQYIEYIKTIWHKERQSRQQLMDEQMAKNHQLGQQLDIMSSKLKQKPKPKHQHHHHIPNIHINVNNEDKNVVSKLWKWNLFKPKPIVQQNINVNQVYIMNVHLFLSIFRYNKYTLNIQTKK